jgi:hypothetical protein
MKKKRTRKKYNARRPESVRGAPYRETNPEQEEKEFEDYCKQRRKGKGHYEVSIEKGIKTIKKVNGVMAEEKRPIPVVTAEDVEQGEVKKKVGSHRLDRLVEQYNFKDEIANRWDPVNKRWKTGNVTLYRPEFDKVAFVMCAKHGATLEDLAQAFGVSYYTINHWMRPGNEGRSSFRAAVRKGRDVFSVEVLEQQLITRATGYEREVEEVRTTTGPKGKTVTKIKRIIHVPPDTKALALFLINRDPSRWAQGLRKHLHAHGHLVEGALKLEMDKELKGDKKRAATVLHILQAAGVKEDDIVEKGDILEADVTETESKKEEAS